MKVDFGQVFKGLEGDEIKNGGKPFTLAAAAVTALLAEFKDEQIAGQQKADRYTLALAVHGAVGEIDQPVEDVALIKTLIGKAYSPLIVGQAWKMLEG